jgi:hypothetical protein
MARADKLLLGTLIIGGIGAVAYQYNKGGNAMIKQLNMALPRSVRLNNPGNIIKTSIGWVGKIDSLDPKFEAFGSPYYGIRAMLLNMRTHHNRGNNTVAKLVRGWSTTDQDAYIQFVGSKMPTGFTAQTVYSWDNPIWARVAWAMAWFEAGGEYYKHSEFQNTWNRLFSTSGGGGW